MERYAYNLDIKFLNPEDAEEFYQETSNLIEWLAEYYDDNKIVLPSFYEQSFNRNSLIRELLEEIEFWEDNELPTVELDDTVSINSYTESFVIFLSEISEKYIISEIEIQELITDEDKDMEIPLDDDEYSISNEDFYEDNSFNELNEY